MKANPILQRESYTCVAACKPTALGEISGLAFLQNESPAHIAGLFLLVVLRRNSDLAA